MAWRRATGVARSRAAGVARSRAADVARPPAIGSSSFAVCAVVASLALLAAAAPAWAQRAPVEASHGIVASASSLASQAGVDILKRGGNSIDAAVATAFALAVTYPRAGNLGGGGFAVLRLADGSSASIDFRETGPAGASRDLYLDAQRKVIPDRSTVGDLAAGVPGTVAGLGLLLQKYGSHRITWSEAVEPARELAATGFRVTPALARDLEGGADLLERFPESKRIFLRGGRLYQAGELFRQPDLAATLRRIQREGPSEFYEGKTAALIANEMSAHGGLITRADLSAYRAVERAALLGSYRGYEIVTMPPPSSGGIALLQMLGMLETHDVAALGLNSAAKIHLFAEVMRRAFRDRAQYLGDPDFVTVPVEHLLDRTYLARQMSDFNPARASSNAALTGGDALKSGDADQSRDGALKSAILPKGVAALAHESTETTHFSIVDSAGNAVSITYTLNGLWGNGVTVPGAGFLLNNEMDDFASKAGVPNSYGLIQGDSNAIAPGKRPLSSMTPTIVSKNGKPFLITGSPGGPTIINTVLLVLTNVIDHGLSLTEAVDAPRFHHQWQPDRIDHEGIFTSPDTLALLQGEGYTLATRTLYPHASTMGARTWGDAESILIDPVTGLRQGANDLRSADSAAVGW